MNANLKAMILMLTVVVGTAALSGYLAFSANQAILDSAMQRELTLVRKLVQSTIDEQIAKASARAALISNLPSVQQAFRAQDPDQLTQQLLAPMLIQREQFGVREAQFHLPPASSFLRLFNLNEPPGEDLSSFRPLVVAANQQHQPAHGISIGRQGLSLRGVYPVADSQGHIGSFEIGMDFVDIIYTIKETSGFDAVVLADDQLMRDIATLQPRPDDDNLFGGFQVVVASNWKFIKPLLSPERLKALRKPTQTATTVDGGTFGSAVIPLKDPNGKVLGALVVARSFEHYAKQRNWAMVGSGAMAGLQVLLLAGVVLLIMNGMLLRPLAALTRMVDDTPEEIPGERSNLLTRSDEIGKLAQHLLQVSAEEGANPLHLGPPEIRKGQVDD